MKVTTIVEATFSGSHTVPGHPICGERHGHTWRVRVEIAAREEELLEGNGLGVTQVIRQYHRRDLDRFLPGVSTTAEGLAAFFRERLSDYPVTSIDVVTDDGYGVRVEWVVR